MDDVYFWVLLMCLIALTIFVARVYFDVKSANNKVHAAASAVAGIGAIYESDDRELQEVFVGMVEEETGRLVGKGDLGQVMASLQEVEATPAARKNALKAAKHFKYTMTPKTRRPKKTQGNTPVRRTLKFGTGSVLPTPLARTTAPGIRY